MKISLISRFLIPLLGLCLAGSAHASIKNDLDKEASQMTSLAASTSIQDAVKSANQNPSQKPNLSGLNNNDLAKKLADIQKNSSMTIIGMMVTDNTGNSLGQTIPAKTLNYRFASSFVSAKITQPKITTRMKVSFSPNPVARIIVPVLDQDKVIGTLTEWIKSDS